MTPSLSCKLSNDVRMNGLFKNLWVSLNSIATVWMLGEWRQVLKTDMKGLILGLVSTKIYSPKPDEWLRPGHFLLFDCSSTIIVFLLSERCIILSWIFLKRKKVLCCCCEKGVFICCIVQHGKKDEDIHFHRVSVAHRPTTEAAGVMCVALLHAICDADNSKSWEH